MSTFQIGKRYTFGTMVPSILGELITNVKYLGEVSYEVARLMEAIDIKHRQLYHHIAGIPDDPSAFTYHIFEGTDNKKVILANVWININSVTVIEATKILITVDGINLDDVEVIRTLLLSSDYTNFDIKIL